VASGRYHDDLPHGTGLVTPSEDSRTYTERRREFQASCIAVGATPRSEFTDFSGMTPLRAIATRYDGLVDIVVLADVFPDDESEPDR
jgi:hypothetical protein